MMFAGYWWGDIGPKRRIHWKRWEMLCCSKLDSSLGFKDLDCFNMTLLAKQWWRIIQDENSLYYRVLKAKYFPKVAANLAEKGQKASYLRNSLLEGKKVVDQGTLWRVGDEKRIDV